MLCAPIPVSEAVLFYVNAPFSAGLAGCRSQHPALRGRPYFAAGPAPAGTPCARSERRAARQAFPAGQAKRRLSGVGRADCAVFNGPVALHKDMDQKGGIQAIVASGRGLLRRDAPRPSRETRGGPPFRELCPVQAAPLCTVRAAAIVPCPCGACPCSSMGAARRPAGIPGGTGKASLAE